MNNRDDWFSKEAKMKDVPGWLCRVKSMDWVITAGMIAVVVLMLYAFPGPGISFVGMLIIFSSVFTLVAMTLVAGLK
jgi:hypothetical protein